MKRSCVQDQTSSKS